MAESYIALRDFQGAEKILGRFVAQIKSVNVDRNHQDKEYVAGVLVTYCSILLRNKRHDQYTEHIITLALHLKEDLQVGWYWLGQLYLARSNYADSGMATMKALDLNRFFVDAILLLGVVCQRLQVPDEPGRLIPEAAWCYLAALKYNSKSKEAVMRLGEVYEQNMLFQEASVSRFPLGENRTSWRTLMSCSEPPCNVETMHPIIVPLNRCQKTVPSRIFILTCPMLCDTLCI